MSNTVAVPVSASAEDLAPIIAFDGAITTRLVKHPRRSCAFAFEVTFLLQHPHLVALSSEKPPMHFHPYQEEYIEVLQGRLGVDMEGEEMMLTPESGELSVRPWANHRLYPPPPSKDGTSEETTTRFLLSAMDTSEVFKLDTIFFQNWYGYQDQIVIGGDKMDIVQVMCMFDAGASYLSFPKWFPFGRTVSRALGVVVGRWIGGVLGYQPFYRKWTTDWELACKKMETSIFQRRFASRAKEA